MGWQRVELVVAGEDAEALAEALEAAGAISAEISDADAGTPGENAVYAEPGADVTLWPHSRVSALFAGDSDASRAAGDALDASGIASIGGASVERVEDADWVALTQRQFDPIRAGERLWIVPTWHEPPEPGAVNIVLDPGAAFGTGSHPTTRLCLAWLERNLSIGDEVIDYGCGSGILAIAALRLGAASAIATDIDPLALEAARYNSAQNGVVLSVVDAKTGIEGRAQVTIANILANPLRMLAPIIASHTRPGGWIALSGILEDQAHDVIEAYSPFARLAVDSREAGWVLVTGRRDDKNGC
jgi:ribosomal protein L11 methyltransferase